MKEEETHVEQFSGIFDMNAQLVKRLVFVKETSSAGASRQAVEDNIEGGAHATIADDGNVYVLASAAQSQVTVVSPTGEILRRFFLKPPFDGAEPNDIFASRGAIAIGYQSAKPERVNGKLVSKYVLATYSRENGSPIAQYTDLPQEMLVCIQGTQLTFLSMGKDGRFAIRHGELR